jgi:myo-inositol-1(or 4)-monophosphatase
MLEAARAAADFIRSSASGLATLDWREKARADFVSDIDVGAESRIADHLLRRFPSAVVLGEELTPSVALMEDLAFIVDPLDGTTNFLHGYPQYAVSIAAISGGETLAGVVLDIARDSVCSATRGGGAQRDGAPIRVSATAAPGRALIGTGLPFKHPYRLDVYMRQLTRVIEETAGVRRAGAAALDLTDVASGRLDGFWELMLAPWDVAAGLLIIREAGGRVTDLEGRDARPVHGPVVASNGILHGWLLALLSPPDAATPVIGSPFA